MPSTSGLRLAGTRPPGSRSMLAAQCSTFARVLAATSVASTGSERSGSSAAAATAASLFGVAGAAAPAMADTGPASVTAVTHSFDHLDTTGFNVYTGDTVWAHDNLMERFVATNNGNGTWTVAITVNGSFDGFADP